jgi:hypothetical protein
LSPEIATSINMHVPFSLSRIIMPGLLLGMVLSVCTCCCCYYYYYYYYYTEDFILMHYFCYVHSGLKWRPSLLDITVIRDLSRNFRNSSLFTPTFRTSPSARCFGNSITFSKQILSESLTFFNQLM